jgi:dihydroceramide fatty acyl 2-hydroxylase
MNTTSYWGNTLHFILHGCHHKYPLDALRLVFPPVPATIFVTLGYCLARAILPQPAALAALAGGVFGYVIYDSKCL